MPELVLMTRTVKDPVTHADCILNKKPCSRNYYGEMACALQDRIK